jgi:hypothetical protein
VYFGSSYFCAFFMFLLMCRLLIRGYKKGVIRMVLIQGCFFCFLVFLVFGFLFFSLIVCSILMCQMMMNGGHKRGVLYNLLI